MDDDIGGASITLDVVVAAMAAIDAVRWGGNINSSSDSDSYEEEDDNDEGERGDDGGVGGGGGGRCGDSRASSRE